MQLANQFEVPVPVDQAWEVLLDVPRVARCLPGATLDERDGDTYHGQVKLKIGSITASYRGQATVSAADPSQRTALVTASGREQRGGGRASAEVRVRLFPDGERTRVEVVTELSITGKAAQFGRGILADVSGRLIDEFARNLADALIAPSGSDGAMPRPATSPEPSSPNTDPEPFDVLGPAHRARVRRYLLVALASFGALIAGLFLGRTAGQR